MLVAPEGNAAAPVTVCNRSEQPVHLRLRLSDFSFVDPATRATVALGSSSRLVAAETADAAIVSGAAPLAPGCVGLRIEVAGLWQAGVATATLSNGGDALTTLTALRRHAPFRIGFDGPNPQRAELKIVKGEPASLTLFNEDDMSYRFHWRLEVPDVAASGVAHVRPNRSVELVVERPGGNISGLESGFLRSAVREGRLLVEHEPDAALEPYALPRRALDVRATISSFTATWQAIWNVVFIFALLVLGIVASLLINYALPMQHLPPHRRPCRSRPP